MRLEWSVGGGKFGRGFAGCTFLQVGFALLIASAASAAPVKVALPGLSAVQIDQKLADFLNEQLAQELSNQGVGVITSKEIGAVLGMERQKELLGCGGEQSSCMAELANALGSDAVMIGDVAKVGARYHLTLKAMAAGSGERLTDFTGSSENEDGLVPLLNKAAAKMAPELSEKTKKPLGERHVTDTVTVSQERRKPSLPWALIGGGAGVLVAGGVFELIASQKYDRLQHGDVGSLEEAKALRQDGKLFNTLGIVGMGVGAAALATGVALKVTSSDGGTQAALTVTHNGIMLVGVIP